MSVCVLGPELVAISWGVTGPGPLSVALSCSGAGRAHTGLREASALVDTQRSGLAHGGEPRVWQRTGGPEGAVSWALLF